MAPRTRPTMRRRTTRIMTMRLTAKPLEEELDASVSISYESPIIFVRFFAEVRKTKIAFEII